MKRVFIGIVLSAVFFVCAHQTASAMLEYCPAELYYHAVASDTAHANDSPSAVYGLDLTALGARTIGSARLTFDTSAGWYIVDLPRVSIVEKDRRYTSEWVTFTRRDYVSQVIYVRFAQPVEIHRAWVSSATAVMDSDTFGWQSRGTVQCDPLALGSDPQSRDTPAHPGPFPYVLDPRDRDPLSAPPSASTPVLAAQSTAASESSTCVEPFRLASVKSLTQARYPSGITLSGKTSTVVEVAVNADGTLADAWVWGPSGYQQFDDAALSAAKSSTYRGALAYCKPVPGRYFFDVTFVTK